MFEADAIKYILCTRRIYEIGKMSRGQRAVECRLHLLHVFVLQAKVTTPIRAVVIVVPVRFIVLLESV